MQSRIDSFMEALVNVAIGFGINFLANWLILPWYFGIEPDLGSFALLGVIYTFISIARSYVIRRAFNGQTVWEALSGRVRTRRDAAHEAAYQRGLLDGREYVAPEVRAPYDPVSQESLFEAWMDGVDDA